MTSPTRLPLFEKTELDELQRRRAALLKRVQGMKKHSHGRQELIGRLKELTAEQIRVELRLYGKRP